MNIRTVVTLAGCYLGPAQHTYTQACDGFHAPGPCKNEAPVTIPSPWQE